jgi:hypothetical protein
MTVARLAEQFEHSGEALPDVVPDVVPVTIAELLATVARLTARVAELELPPENFVPLKTAAFDCGMVYETLRAWCALGKVEARREGKLWLVNVTNVKERQRRRGQRK